MGERARLARLLRFVGAFLAWPSLTTALAFWIFSGWEGHWLHIAGLLPVGVGGVVLIALAPRLAARYAPEDDA